MISFWRPARLFTLLLLLYVTADFMDPFTPGVFFFENDVLFVDGVVQFKSDVSTSPTPLLPVTSTGKPVVADDDNVVAKEGAALRLLLPPLPLHAKNQKHDDSPSFASTSPPDPVPLPS